MRLYSDVPTRKSAGRRLLGYLLPRPIGEWFTGNLQLLQPHESPIGGTVANRPGAVLHFIPRDLRRGVVRGLRCIGRYWSPERLRGTTGVHACRSPDDGSLATATRRRGAARAGIRRSYIYIHFIHFTASPRSRSPATASRRPARSPCAASVSSLRAGASRGSSAPRRRCRG